MGTILAPRAGVGRYNENQPSDDTGASVKRVEALDKAGNFDVASSVVCIQLLSSVRVTVAVGLPAISTTLKKSLALERTELV